MSRSQCPFWEIGTTINGLDADGSTLLNTELEGAEVEVEDTEARTGTGAVGRHSGGYRVYRLVRNSAGSATAYTKLGCKFTSGYYLKRVSGVITAQGGHGFPGDDRLSASVGISDFFGVVTRGTTKITAGGTVTSGDRVIFNSSGKHITQDLSAVSGSTDGIEDVLQQSALGAKVGTDAGWTVNAANNIAEATVAASQTGSDLVVPLHGLKVGDVISGFGLLGQIESAGGTVTVDGDLRRETAVAADPTDASVSTMTQISKTADYKIGSADDKTGLTEVVGADEQFYLLLAATTAASTDIRLLGARLLVKRNVANNIQNRVGFAQESATSDQEKLVFVTNN